MSDARIVVIVTSLALLSLLLTFVLFRLLKAQAEGQGKLLGGTIKYGGSLAGFVLIFSILFGAFYRLHADPGVTTPVSLAGTWSVEMQTSRHVTLAGVVTIRQQQGDPVLEMGGEITTGKPVTFSTIVGVIRDRDVYFVYDNLEGERGIIHGKVSSDSPTSLRLIYTDLAGFDRNNDPTGVLLLKKRQ